MNTQGQITERKPAGIRLLFLKDNKVREGNKWWPLNLISEGNFYPKCHPPCMSIGLSYKNCHCLKSYKWAIPAATASSLTSFPLI